jgi:hypothetical protein
MRRISSKTSFWQTTFALTFIVNLTILIWSISRWVELKVVMWRSVWLIPLTLYLAVLAGCIWLFIWVRKGNAGRLLTALELEKLTGPFWQICAGFIFTGILLLIPYLKFTFHVGEVVKKSTQDPILTMIVFYWLVWWLLLLAAGALKVAFKTNWEGGFAAALVILGVAYEIFVRLDLVSAYPFSMGWSESSRYYYASLYFSQSIYGEKIPLSTLHPSRYLLQSIPFLFPSLGLTFSRLWQFLLWIGLTGASAVTLAWRAFSSAETGGPEQSGFARKAASGTMLRILCAGWIFLFLLRVGVYYHLEVMLFVPLLFISARHPWRSLILVILTSAWAGISRVNWFPVPAMLAIALYLLEQPVTSAKNIRRYFFQPAVWAVCGLASALAAQAAYIPLSGNAANAKAFASSFFSEMLWVRLWPNDSFPLGIIPAILIVSGPLLVIVLMASLGSSRKRFHPLRWLGLWAMLLMLFIGGLVVSVKIGGGGDLHNMDAYATLIAVLAAFILGGRAQVEFHPGSFRDDDGPGQDASMNIYWPVAAVALLIPLLFLIPLLSPLPKYNQKGNQQALEQLKGLAEQAGQHGPVLFINERHLLTFHQINLPLVPEYEAVTLMETAMSNNQATLQQFYGDLKNHRFAAIVAGKQNVGIKEEGAFAEENNTWNSRISPYIQCYYEPVMITNGPDTLSYIEADQSRIEFYVPRSTPGVCP